MTVGELKELLEEFDEDIEVMDYAFNDIEEVKEELWEHRNYPYNKPSKKIVMIS